MKSELDANLAMEPTDNAVDYYLIEDHNFRAKTLRVLALGALLFAVGLWSIVLRACS